MIKKSTAFWVPLLFVFIAFSCGDDDVLAPPKSAVDVDLTSGLVGETEFTFTIDEVSAKSIALWPEGVGRKQSGISVSSFTAGKAEIKYKYANVGTFQPVVVTTNFNAKGETMSSTSEPAGTVTITSQECKITAFNFGRKKDQDNTGGNVKVWEVQSIRTTIIDKNATNPDTIRVWVPYAPFGAANRAGMIAQFSTSANSSAKIGSTAQVSETTANNWSTLLGALTPSQDSYGYVDYEVTAHNGTTKRTYKVEVIQVKSSSHTLISSFSAKSGSNAYRGYADSVSRVAIVYAPYGTASSNASTLKLGFGLSSPFSKLKNGTTTLAQDAAIDLSTSKVLTAEAQNGVTTNYDTYFAVAPRLEVSINGLNPSVSGSSDNAYGLSLNVLDGTSNPISTNFSVTTNAGVSVSKIVVMSGPSSAVTTTTINSNNGNATIDTDYAVNIEVTVNDSNIGETYVAKYKLSVKTL